MLAVGSLSRACKPHRWASLLAAPVSQGGTDRSGFELPLGNKEVRKKHKSWLVAVQD
jgi:hypothetical protein